jgi:hypothetical protein
VKLTGQHLHLVAGQILGAEDDGEGITREGPVGEHVDDVVRQCAHGAQP